MKGMSPTKNVYQGFFLPDWGLKAVLLTMPLRAALFSLAVPLWLPFPSQCWSSMETGWRRNGDAPPNPTVDKTLLGKGDFPSYCPKNGLCSPTMSFSGSGHASLVLPETGEQRALEWSGEETGVERTLLNVGRGLTRPGPSGHGLDDLIGLSHSWSVVYKCTFRSRQVNPVTEFSFPSPLPFTFSSWHLEMFPIIGSHKQRHEVQAWEMFRKHLPASCIFILGRLPGARLIQRETAIAAI